MKVYVHVPFCAAKCAYCDFYSTPHSDWMEAYVRAVGSEWEERSRDFDEPVETLYFGGGTPSLLPVGLLKGLVDIFPLTKSLREATIEVNPEDVTSEFVDFIMKETPFRRVSMGIQSFVDSELKTVGRRHSALRAVEAFKCLRMGGIDNISCDLIYGLPLQTPDSWRYSLESLLALDPEHISAYLLSFEPGTRLNAMLSAGKVEEADEETVSEMYDILCSMTRKAGYIHYEVSNFARPGREAIHNSGYWDGSAYIGLGPGAHSYIEGQRSFNPSSLKDYIAAGGRRFNVVDEETELNRYNDMIITRLRTLWGLHPDEIVAVFGTSLAADFEIQASFLVSKGLIIRTEDGSYAIPEHRLLESDTVIRSLIKV